ncbi:hypothetical protein CCR85_08740 [Rhodothalassium salexigens]|nr:hypothetical protein [Rhodothalassium salexigens]MBK5920125.1 hypothetical protein [Rhodothalassium salexigens]
MPMTQLPFDLSIAGLDELADLHNRGISHAVSLIDPDEPDPPALDRMALASRMTLRLHDLIDERAGLRAPDREDVRHLIAHADALAPHQVRHLLVHCHMGRSRSTAAAAILLYRMQVTDAAGAFAAVASVRDPIWPNSRMLRFADEFLDTGGALIEAVKPVYHRMVETHPEWTGLLKHTERARDLDID